MAVFLLLLLEESLANKLNLQGEKYSLCLRWTADTCRYEDDATRVSVDISCRHNGSDKSKLIDVYTVKEVNLPSQSLPALELADKYSHLSELLIKSYSTI